MIWSIIQLFAGSFIVSLVLVILLIPLLKKLNIVDMPDGRRIHNIITPRGGGLSIVLTVIVMGLLLQHYVLHGKIDITNLLSLFTVISFISFLDDIKPLSVVLRFITHIICSSLVVAYYVLPMISVGNDLLNILFAVILVLSLTFFINLYNFLDGTDGLTAVETIHLCFFIITICYLYSQQIFMAEVILMIATITLGCIASFIIFNWHPAKIFMGDVGTIGLGFLIGFLMLLISLADIKFFNASIIASLYYIADGCLTILIRLINKEKIWEPHLKHFFQQALRMGKSNNYVILHVIACNIILLALSLLSIYHPLIALGTAILVTFLTLYRLVK